MENTEYDLLIVGATPSGIAAGVRAAREELSVLITTSNHRVGGVLSNGIGTADTMYRGVRSPVFDEYCELIADHYREGYDRDRDTYPGAIGGSTEVPLGHLWEPHVAENTFTDLVENAGVEVQFGYRVQEVKRDGKELTAIKVEPTDDGDSIHVEADAFIDATYMGDLVAKAGVEYRIGREPRTEFGEQHAGRLFTGSNSGETRYPRAVTQGELNTSRTLGRVSAEIFSGSTGEGDNAIQSYNFRLCLSSEESNRKRPEKPEDYDRSRYVGIVKDAETVGSDEYPVSSGLLTKTLSKKDPEEDAVIEYSSTRLPNQKLDWNAADFPGQSHAYPKADPETRESIESHHRNHALGLLYFLQNDDAIPRATQEEAREELRRRAVKPPVEPDGSR